MPIKIMKLKQLYYFSTIVKQQLNENLASSKLSLILNTFTSCTSHSPGRN